MTTSTCIDHVYTNNSDLFSHRGLVEPGLSDHCLIFVARKRRRISREKVTVKIRSYRNFDADVFNHDVECTDWSSVYNASNVDEATDSFNHIFTALLDQHLPWKSIRVRRNNAPWINSEFLSLIDAREYHARQYRKCPCSLHLGIKKNAQRLVQRMKNALKRDYVQECLEKYKDDPKRLWREIRNFWPGKKSSNTPIGNVNGLTSSIDKQKP